MRVVECRLAAKLLAKFLDQEVNNVSILKQVQDLGNFSLEDMIKHTKSFLHQTPYTRPEIASLLGLTESDLTKPSFIGTKVKSSIFHLHQRALHVFSESHLVSEFSQLCLSQTHDPQKSQKLGTLMSASHESCRNNFDCSCPDLDNLVKICVNSGAYGARLTGAGWGGCIVAIVPKSAAKEFYDKVKKEYFEKNFDGLVKQHGIENYFFETAPEQGAFIIHP